jgi:hypothetical protein
VSSFTESLDLRSGVNAKSHTLNAIKSELLKQIVFSTYKLRGSLAGAHGTLEQETELVTSHRSRGINQPSSSSNL